MEDLLTNARFWHWWVLAALLLVVEVVLPGTFFLWLAVAAGLVGLLLLPFPGLPWQVQILIFAVAGLVAVVGWRSYARRHPPQTDDPTLNRRGARYVGQVFVLDEAIVNGRGKVRVADTVWPVAGPELAKGARVRVIGVAGTVLEVTAEG